MTYLVHTFTLTDARTCELVGHAAICVEARYGSIRFAGDDAMVRRHALPYLWKALEGELRAGFPSGALPATSAVVTFLVLPMYRDSVVVQALGELPVSVDRDDAAARGLDQLLRGLTATPALSLRQD